MKPPEGLRLTLDTDPPASLQAELGRLIGDFNAQTVPGEVSRFAMTLHDAKGTMAAGLSGWIYWDWLFIAALWVHGHWRGRGAGSALLMAAETHAAAAGCHSVWLDTFQAQGFYEKHGYTLFGALPDYPKGQTRAFLQKRLT